jgi:hypothetical protein
MVMEVGVCRTRGGGNMAGRARRSKRDMSWWRTLIRRIMISLKKKK